MGGWSLTGSGRDVQGLGELDPAHQVLPPLLVHRQQCSSLQRIALIAMVALEGRKGQRRAEEGRGGQKRAEEGKGGQKRAEEGRGGQKRAEEGKGGQKRAEEGKGEQRRVEEGRGG